MNLRSRLLRLLVVALLSAAALIASPAPAATPSETKYGNKVFTIVNDYRSEHGRAALRRNKCLNRFAAKQAQAMADKGQLFHQDLNKIARACGLGYVGENVVYGAGPAKSTVQMWLQSPPHKKNILNRKYKLTGVAARMGGGYWWVAQVFGRKS